MERQNIVEENVNYARRLENVAAPVMIENVERCAGNTTGYSGAHFMTLDSVGASYQDAIKNLYNVGTRPTVTIAAKNTPAGGVLKTGDMITHINGKALPENRDSLDILKGMVGAGDAFEITINNASGTHNKTLKPQTACNTPILLSTKSGAKIFEDDGRLMVTKDMMNQVQSDQELAQKIEAKYSAIIR